MSDTEGFVRILLRGVATPIELTPKDGRTLEQLAKEIRTDLDIAIGPNRDKLNEIRHVDRIVFVQPSQVVLVEVVLLKS